MLFFIHFEYWHSNIDVVHLGRFESLRISMKSKPIDWNLNDWKSIAHTHTYSPIDWISYPTHMHRSPSTLYWAVRLDTNENSFTVYNILIGFMVWLSWTFISASLKSLMCIDSSSHWQPQIRFGRTPFEMHLLCERSKTPFYTWMSHPIIKYITLCAANCCGKVFTLFCSASLLGTQFRSNRLDQRNSEFIYISPFAFDRLTLYSVWLLSSSLSSSVLLMFCVCLVAFVN